MNVKLKLGDKCSRGHVLTENNTSIRERKTPCLVCTECKPKTADYLKRYYHDKTSFKYKAREKLRDAVKLKKVFRKPCEVCGNQKSEGHHTDYSKPLEVRWLCRKHHMALHTKSVPSSLVLSTT